MPFVLDPFRPVQREVRRVTRECFDEALSILSGIGETDLLEIEGAVHDIRKRCKEVRGLAHLVRSALGDGYDQFDKQVRDAANELGPIRDAHALLATFDDLREKSGRTDDDELGTVRAAQASAARAATQSVLGTDPRIERARRLLEKSRRELSHWDIPDGSATIAKGIEDTYRRGQRDYQRALKRPTDHRMHEWRKSAKHLWYQVRLIERAAPSVLKPLVANLDGLAEALGDDHDLAVLIERLTEDPENFGGRRQVKHARRLARSQQDELRHRAFRLAGTIYAETPTAVARRMHTYWETTIEHGLELATGGIAELAPDEQRADEGKGPVERERKFLVEQPLSLPEAGVALRQGYLAIDGSVSVRVRDAGQEGCTLTVKAGRGAVRTELEWSLTPEQFGAAWDQTRGRRIHKTRYHLPLDEHEVELDVFDDELAGLVVAEVEFETDDALAAFRPPDWFGTEVTDDDTYTNTSLAANASLGVPARKDRR